MGRPATISSICMPFGIRPGALHSMKVRGMWCSIRTSRKKARTSRKICCPWRKLWLNSRRHPEPILACNIDQWALESNDIARDFVYPELTLTENKKYCRLSSIYVSRANALARQRLILAAWRLAALLNATLGADNSSPPAPYPAGPPSQTY